MNSKEEKGKFKGRKAQLFVVAVWADNGAVKSQLTLHKLIQSLATSNRLPEVIIHIPLNHTN